MLSFRLSAVSSCVLATALGLTACSTKPVDETAGWSPNKIYAEARDEAANGAYDKAVTLFEKLGAVLWRKIQPVAKALLPLDRSAKALAYGLCWGFLPCGLVYSSLGWSLASGSALQGALLMCAFGLGTLPAMLAVGSFARSLSRFKNKNWVRACAALLLALYALYTIAIALAPRLF